jgi:hypothetical protein
MSFLFERADRIAAGSGSYPLLLSEIDDFKVLETQEHVVKVRVATSAQVF